MAVGGVWCDTRNGSRITDLEGGGRRRAVWHCESIILVGSSGKLVCSAIPVWEKPTVLYASRCESNGHDLPDRQQCASRASSTPTSQLAPVVRPTLPN